MTAGGVRGIHNNNPGNLRSSGEQWDGLSASQSDPSFYSFQTPEHGIRAMTKVLENYQVGHGLQTVADMINRYAPPSENSTNDYARSVANDMGVDQNAAIDFSNEETAAKMVGAMIRMENGANPYSPEQLRAGIRAGLGIEDLPGALAASGGATINISGDAAQHLRDTASRAVPQFDPPAPYRGKVSFNDIHAPAPWTLAMQEDQQKREAAMAPGLVEGAKLAVQSEWGAAWAMMDNPTFIEDPSFKLRDNQEFYKELTKGVPTKYLDVFSDAVSADHARFLRQRLDQELEVEDKLGRMGWTGAGLRVGAALLDPVSIGAAVASEGLAAPLIAASKAGRIGKAVLAGSTAMAGSLPPALMLADQKLTSDWTDVAHMAFGAFALGGAIRAARGGADAAEQAAMASISAKARDRIENSILPEGLDPRIDQLRKELGVLRVKAGDDAPLPVHDVHGQVPEAQLQDSVGAARAASYQEPLSSAAEAIRIDAADAPYTAMGKVRFDAVGQGKSSKHPLVRQTMAVLGEDAVGNADHSVNLWGASERQALMQREFQTRFHRDAEPLFKQWAEERGMGWFERQRERTKFMGEVATAMRDDLAEVSPQARQLASSVASLKEEMLMLAKNPGRREGIVSKSVKGFADVQPNRNYVPRMYDARRVRELVAEFGDKNVASLFAHSMVANNPELDMALAEQYARWHVKKVRGHAIESDISTMRALAGEDYDTLREILHAEGAMDPDGIESLINILKKPGEGAHSRAKRRLALDENFSMPLTNIYGTEARDVAIKDFLINDIEQLFNHYTRQLSGAVALARTGYSSRGEVETMLKHIRQSAGEVAGYSEKELERDIANLEFMFTMVSGAPVGSFGSRIFADKSSRVGQITRLLRDYNFTRVMNQVGFAQIAEMGNVMGSLGFRTAIEAMPSFKTLWRNAKTGKLDDKLADEMEAIWGIGTDELRGVVMNRWDDFGSSLSPVEGKWMNRIDTALAYGKKITNDLSGMAAINTILHRWTAKGIAHKFADMAYSGKTFSKARQASLGLSDDMMGRISQQIRDHSDTAVGTISGRKMRQINLDQWTDDAAAENFRLAVFRLSRRIVQENDAGNMHRWFSTGMGQMIFQFRNFTNVAWAKQTLAGLHQRDWDTFAAWTASTFAGAASYIAQTTLASAGREDQDTYLEKKLSPEEIGKAAFQRAGWSSLLPLGIENTAGLLTQDPIFDYRTTGLSTSIFGNPTFDLIDKGKQSMSGIGRLVLDPDYKLSQDNIRDFTGVLPFSNMLGIKNGLNVLARELPRHSD